MTLVPRIKCSLTDINSQRSNFLINTFKTIAKKNNRIVPNQRSLGGQSYIIGLSDSYETGLEYRGWRFKTYINGINASYYERYRSYFHLYKMNEIYEEEVEYILVHCDSSEPDSSDHGKYKQSPHLHIKCAEEPIPHAHFALNIGNLEFILSSIENLNIALRDSVEMINSQVLFQLA